MYYVVHHGSNTLSTTMENRREYTVSSRCCVLSFLLLLLLSPTVVQGQQGSSKTIIVSYNTENLFDIIDNPDTNDDDFTPQGIMQWGEKKYQDKIKRIARVLSEIGRWEYPGIVGLCEIENATVVKDIFSSKTLRNIGYQYAVTNSDDARGINVALAWNPLLYAMKEWHELVPPLHNPRHILHVTLYALQHTPTTSTPQLLDLFVVHAPSRRSGTRASSPLREGVMRYLRKSIDSLLQSRPDANIIIMGDFNDNPSNKSIRQSLGALPIGGKHDKKTYDNNKLYNLATAIEGTDKGSHVYKQRAWIPDQIIVSGSLLSKQKNTLHIKGRRMAIFTDSFLQERGGKNGEVAVPKRSFKGEHYNYGYSDHYPVYVELEQ